MSRDLRLSLALLAAVAAACGGNNTSGNNGSLLTIIPSPTSVPADGVSTITLTLKGIAADGTSPYNGSVDLTSKADVIYGDTSVENDIVAMVAGKATQTIACAPGTNCVGQIVLNGSLISNGANASAATQVTFTAVAPPPDGGDAGPDAGGTNDGGDGGLMDGGDAGPPAPGQIQFVGTANPYMGVDYGPTGVSQFIENTFTFEVDDSTGKIPIAGVPVTFTAIGSGALPAGSYLEGTDAGTETVVGTTDKTGRFALQAHSGQASGTITITATVNGTDIQTIGQGSVVGTQPSVFKSSLSCTPENLPVYLGSAGSYPCETSSDVLQKTVCTANLADRFGNVVTVQVAVKFFSEAGNFESPSTQTPPFSVTAGTGQTFGAASNTLDTNGSLPEDVDPLPANGSIPGEPFYVDQCAGLPGHTYNPRDGLVTVIAVFEGEEAFIADSTKVYEPGNEFTDLPQPFVDSNDNSVWDPGEACVGQSVAGECGGPNGVWDANTNVFIVSHVLYTGHANESTAVCNNCVVSPLQGTTISFWPQRPNVAAIPESGAVTGTINYADINLNPPAPEALTNVDVTGPQSLQLKYPANVATCVFVGDLGMSVIPLANCTDGGVPDDAGNPVESTICVPRTSITDFTGGVSGCAYQLTNGNTTDAGAQPYSLTATLGVEANSDSQNYSGFAL